MYYINYCIAIVVNGNSEDPDQILRRLIWSALFGKYPFGVSRLNWIKEQSIFYSSATIEHIPVLLKTEYCSTRGYRALQRRKFYYSIGTGSIKPSVLL